MQSVNRFIPDSTIFLEQLDPKLGFIRFLQQAVEFGAEF
jgi:hypothetical protein